MTPTRLVVFDMDGTLMDSQDHIVRAMEGAFSEFGLAAPARDEILSIVGLSLYEAVAQLRPGHPEPERIGIAEAYKRAFIAQRSAGQGEGTAPLYPGARETLDTLAARLDVQLGIATGKARRGLDHALAAHRLAPYFSTCQTADLHPSKPHPAMLLACMAEAGAAPENTVMVGDTTFDMEMGRAAGVRTLGVTWGYHPVSALKAAGADRLVDGFDAVLPALDALWTRGR